jgi:hypothetical protein
MGCCCYPESNPDGTQNWVNASGPDSCGMGGLYTSDPCPAIVGGPCGLQIAGGTGTDAMTLPMAMILAAMALRRRLRGRDRNR